MVKSEEVDREGLLFVLAPAYSACEYGSEANGENGDGAMPNGKVEANGSAPKRFR